MVASAIAAISWWAAKFAVGQQQIDHDPRGQLPRLNLARLDQHSVNHLKRHNLRQIAQMTGSEPACSDSDNTGDDRLCGQRSSRDRGRLVRTFPLTELPCLPRTDTPDPASLTASHPR